MKNDIPNVKEIKSRNMHLIHFSKITKKSKSAIRKGHSPALKVKKKIIIF